MTAKDNLQEKLDELGRAIACDDSLAATVMSRIHGKPLAKSERHKNRLVIRRFVMNRFSKSAAAAVIIIAVVLSLTFLEKSVTPTWAIDETIQALGRYNAVYVSGTASSPANGPRAGFNIWAKADEKGTESGDFKLELDDGRITWVKGNDTYNYDPNENTVRIVRGQRASISPWIGRDLFETLKEMMDEWHVLYGKDPATGRDLAFVTCQASSPYGPRSWWFEFDIETKLPVRFKQWHNHRRQGAPAFDGQRIIFYEDLPDEVFEFEIPESAKTTEVFVPEWAFEIVNDPNFGVSADGLSQDEACRKILEQFWQALIDEDLSRIRRLLPVAANWGDEVLIANLGLRDDDSVVEVLEIGRPSYSTSDIGPVAVVPSVLKCKDGKTREVEMIIQFRLIDSRSSCVIYSSHGKPREIN